MPKKGRARERERAQRIARYIAHTGRLRRARTIIGAVAFLPLLAALACGPTSGALFICAVPREWYLALWAGAFGTFIGLTIRLYRERRSFEREQRA